MGAVIDYLACECGGLKFNEYNYKYGSESTLCQKCGETVRVYPDCNEDGSFIYETYEDEGVTMERPIYKRSEKGGFGILNLDGAITVIESKEHGLEVLEAITECPPTSVCINKSYLYLYDKETKLGTVVWGNSAPIEYEEIENLSDEDIEPCGCEVCTSRRMKLEASLQSTADSNDYNDFPF